MRAKLESVHTETVEAAMCVDAPLCAGIGGGAFIYVNTRLPIIFQAEARAASTFKSYFQVFTVLRAATQFAVQALVNKAVQLIRAIAAIVLTVAEQRLIETVSIITGESSIIAFLFWSIAMWILGSLV